MRTLLSFRPLFPLVLAVALVSLALTGCSGSLQSLTAATASAAVASPTATPSTTSATASPSIAASPTAATATGSGGTTQVIQNPGAVVPQSGSGNGAIADAAAAIGPGVVEVTNEQFNINQLQGQQGLVPQGIGSGFIFDQQGHILTNNHVVEGAQKIQVSLPDGRTFPATLVGADPRSDLAVIQIHGSNLPVVPLGDSDKLVIGQWVVASGYALGLEGGPTVTAGIVSALNRTVQEPADQTTGQAPFLIDVIQTSAPINPGNSGGPLVNLNGQVVGINTLAAVQAEPGVQAQNVGFAIAINTAKPIADELIRTGHVTYPFIGVQTYPNDPAVQSRLNLSTPTGEVIVQVVANSPAAAAGLKQYDVITAIDNTKLTDPSSIYRVLYNHKPGDTVTLTIVRGSQTQQVPVKLGTAPSS